MLYCILLVGTYSPLTAPTARDLLFFRHRTSVGFKYRYSMEDVTGLMNSELKNAHDYTCFPDTEISVRLTTMLWQATAAFCKTR